MTSDRFNGWAVICLGGLGDRTDGQPTFGVKVYGTWISREHAEAAAGDIRRLEGGAILVRPLTDLAATHAAISAD